MPTNLLIIPPPLPFQRDMMTSDISHHRKTSKNHGRSLAHLCVETNELQATLENEQVR